MAARSGAAARGATVRGAAARGLGGSPAETGWRHWALSGLLLVGLGVAASGLAPLLAGLAWWFSFMVPATAVLLAASIVRSTARHRVWSSVAGVGAGVASVTLLSAPGTALLGFIPTFATFGAFHELEVAGTVSIAIQDIPATAGPGILYLLALGGAGVAFAADLFAHQLRVPVLAGLPLLLLVVMPGFVRTKLSDPWVFLLTAIVWLVIVLFESPRLAQGGRFAVGSVAAALAAALLLPLALPAVHPVIVPGAAGGLTTGLNPILTLGNDLRRANPTLALTYTTSGPDGQYLRLTALDDFTGRSWEPTNIDLDPTNDVELIGPIPGLGADVPVTEAFTEVTVGGILSRWLPVPYAPASITSLEGDWSWEPDGLTVRTETSNVQEQQYGVRSVQVAPSIEQLRAAGTSVEPGMERYLDIPSDLPSVVGATAAAVVGDAATNYDRAIALQSFFRDGDFVYSEIAPVEQGFDGSGASVLESFLQVKSGYCVHFSSAMAAMARTLGIPARVVVGFTPGERNENADTGTVTFRVTTQNFHAWPELYFTGIGWVRFEPTPGRGFEPAFAPLAQDDPSTPDVDESVPAPVATSTPAPSATPTRAPGDDLPVDPDAAGPSAATSDQLVRWPLFLALALALLLTPWAVRAVRGRSRMAAVRAGSARAAWDELRAVVTDLGIAAAGDSLTPRQLADALAPMLDDGAASALARVRGSLEAEVFAGGGGSGDGGAGGAGGAGAAGAAGSGAGAAGAAGGDPTVADVRALLRGFRRASPLGARLVARLLPRSLAPAWLPRPETVGQRH